MTLMEKAVVMEKKFFSDFEALSREDIEALKLERLKKQVAYLDQNSPYYQEIFRQEKINSEDFKNLDDLKRIPFIDKYMVGESQERRPPIGILRTEDGVPDFPPPYTCL